MALIKALGGTSDILPEEVRIWQQLEGTAHRLFQLYGFQEIRTPVLEDAQLFRRSLGEQTEVVSKQMYEFTDRGSRQIALRPEGTASVVRAFLEHGFDTTGGLTRWYYMGPMFRADRPQAGRKRQFHQMGVEVFGSPAPYQDAEVIQLLRHLLTGFGLDRFQLRLNSLGCREDRKRMSDQIRKEFDPVKGKLCSDCQWRLTHNPLRILDCKEPTCVAQQHRVDVGESVCAGCKAHFQQVLEALESSGLTRDLDYVLDSSLVRGLDYYTKTAFEVTHPDLGSVNALGGGGRYDDLVESLGGIPTPAVGFAVGIDRILMVKKLQQSAPHPETRSDVFVAAVGETSLKEAFRLLNRLRSAGVSGVTDYEARPLKRQLEQANKWGCRLVLMVGERELQEGVVLLKEMASGEQVKVPQSSCIQEVARRLSHGLINS